MKLTLKRPFRGFSAMHWAALVFIVILLVVSTLVEYIPSFDPLAQNSSNRFLPVGSSGHLLGTDQYGRDILARLLYGARIELFIAFSATVGALILGTFIGLIGGYFGKFFGGLSMRSMDVLMTMPPLLLAMFVVTLYGAGEMTLTVALIIIFLPAFARIAYGQTLTVRAKEYVEADVLYGASSSRIILKTIIPNIMAPIIVQFTLVIAAAILMESGLSFLGLGVVPPTPSWGSMVAEATRFMATEPAALMTPAITVIITILAFSLVGDGLRRSYDPRNELRLA